MVRNSVGRWLSLFVSGAVVALFLVSSHVHARVNIRSAPQEPVTVRSPAPASLLMHYQGRLLDPATGNAKPDGTYEMSFRIYNVETGGTALWTETKDVAVASGLFNVLLGDTMALDPAIFNGQNLWLAIKVGADAEATPRQRVTYVGYAFYTRDADMVDGQHADAFAAAGHNHDSAYVNDNANEVDNADVADGALSPAKITGTAWTSTNDGSGSGLDADTVDGQQASSFASSSHIHDDRYYTEGESESRYVNTSGDTMSGTLTVPEVKYSSPRTHYFTVGGEGFVPGSNVDYTNTYGTGGAYITASGFHALVAPVHLPQGATITSFKVFFDDTSTGDMTVDLDRHWLASSYSTLAQVSSSGASGYYSVTDTTINSPVVDNTTASYSIYAYSSSWSSALRIKGAVITYTIDEAP